ncbi:hypothetical protein B0O99DRAFT_589185 [Bisporella sp. PMI_857]|nr:hypothetical protein B0O99DRAFT_589185 [Bisporella sp. PMI_857]
MVRPKSEGRSRGCDICKQRKIKCDGKIPECTPCIKARRKCSGAVSGMVFLEAKNDADSSKSNKIVYERNESAEKSLTLLHASTRRSSTLSSGEDNEPHELDAVLVPWSNKRSISRSPTSQYRNSRESSRSPISLSPNRISSSPIIPPTVPNHNVYIEQYVSTVLQNIKYQGEATWLLSMPSIFLQTTTLGKATLAVALAYHGNLQNNRSLTIESYKYYGEALQDQRQDLQDSNQYYPTAEEICVPIMLAQFEATCSQSWEAYCQHIFAAERLMNVRGPASCGELIFFQMLDTLKTHLMHISIARRIPSIFSKESWRTVPYCHQPITTSAKVRDLLLQIPSILQRLDNLPQESIPQLLIDERASIEVETQAFLLQLDHLWQNFLESTDNGDPNIFLTKDFGKFPETERDITTMGMAVAHHRCAKMLCLHILSCLHLVYENELEVHFSETLNLVETLFAGHDLNLNPSYPRFIWLLRCLSFTSQRVEDKQRACSVLERCATNTGLWEIKMEGQARSWGDGRGAPGWRTKAPMY